MRENAPFFSTSRNGRMFVPSLSWEQGHFYNNGAKKVCFLTWVWLLSALQFELADGITGGTQTVGGQPGGTKCPSFPGLPLINLKSPIRREAEPKGPLPDRGSMLCSSSVRGEVPFVTIASQTSTPARRSDQRARPDQTRSDSSQVKSDSDSDSDQPFSTISGMN